jgi:hypothetical protein
MTWGHYEWPGTAARPIKFYVSRLPPLRSTGRSARVVEQFDTSTEKSGTFLRLINSGTEGVRLLFIQAKAECAGATCPA